MRYYVSHSNLLREKRIYLKTNIDSKEIYRVHFIPENFGEYNCNAVHLINGTISKHNKTKEVTYVWRNYH